MMTGWRCGGFVPTNTARVEEEDDDDGDGDDFLMKCESLLTLRGGGAHKPLATTLLSLFVWNCVAVGLIVGLFERSGRRTSKKLQRKLMAMKLGFLFFGAICEEFVGTKIEESEWTMMMMKRRIEIEDYIGGSNILRCDPLMLLHY